MKKGGPADRPPPLAMPRDQTLRQMYFSSI